MGPGAYQRVEVNWMGTIKQSDVPRDEWRKCFWEGVFSGIDAVDERTKTKGGGGAVTKAEATDLSFEEFCFMGAHRNGIITWNSVRHGNSQPMEF